MIDLKFHDLRRTFCSLLVQNGVSTTVSQRLLEHSSPDLTNKIYTNIHPVLDQSINQLPVEQWLQRIWPGRAPESIACAKIIDDGSLPLNPFGLSNSLTGYECDNY